MNTVKLLNDLSKNHDSYRILSWDEYFISTALLLSCRSSCKRLHVGSVIVKNNRIISGGYNGFLPGAPHTSIIVDNHEIATVHSEQNAIADCANRGVSVKDATIYITHFPCVNCAKIIARHLTERHGLFVGISAGANVFAAFQWLRDNNKKNAITILCDRGERYLSCL